MGWNNSGMASGAASGAAAGSVFGPWGTAIGGVAGGVMGGLSGDSGSAPPPNALPTPMGPGGVLSNNMSGWTDMNTGLTTMYDNGFDPSSMGQYWDAQADYNAFRGRGNEGITNTIDWQLKKLQQQYDQMSQAGAKSQAEIPSQFQGIQPYLDPKTGDLADFTRDPDGIKAGKYGDAGKKIYDEFMSSTQGNYGSGGFNPWLKDQINRNVQPRLAEFKKWQGTQQGNQQTSTAALNDLKNQIDFLTQQKAQYGGNAPAGSTGTSGAGSNPFDPFLKDLGAKWQGNMDNVNPRTDAWGALTDKSISEAQNADPTEFMRQYLGSMTDPAQREAAAAKFQSELEQRINGANVPIERVSPSLLDADAPALQERADNFRAAQSMRSQQDLLRQRLGSRGLSALGEIQAAGAGQSLVGQELQNAAAARGQFNDITSRNFGMQSQAASQNNDAALRAGALGLQGTNLLASNYNSNQGNLFNQGLQQAGFAQSLKDNWFKQAQAALGTANAMRSEDRSWNLQDYQNKLAENQALYGRTNDQYNRLTGAAQQAFQNQLSTRAANQGQYSTLNNTNMQLAGWNNEANVANAQMQNSYNAAQAQREAAANAAQWQGIGNAVGAGLNAYGQYAGKNPSTPASTGSSGGAATPGSTINQWDSAYNNPWLRK